MQEIETTHSEEIFKEMFADLLKSGKDIRLKALGWSMHPTIKNGEYVVIKAIACRDTKIGDIIVCQNINNKKIVIHRLVKKLNSRNSPILITKGDNNFSRSTDSPIDPDEFVLGKVISIEKPNKIINLENSLSWLSNYLIVWLSLYLPWVLLIRRKFIRALEIPHLIPLKLYQNFIRVIKRLKRNQG